MPLRRVDSAHRDTPRLPENVISVSLGCPERSLPGNLEAPEGVATLLPGRPIKAYPYFHVLSKARFRKDWRTEPTPRKNG